MSSKILVVVAAGEAVTGLALLFVPSMVSQLLFGAEVTPIAAIIAGVGGIALIGLGVACWPGPPRVGILTYSAVVTLYLLYVGTATDLTGVLLWPAIAVHLILTVLLARASTSETGSSA